MLAHSRTLALASCLLAACSTDADGEAVETDSGTEGSPTASASPSTSPGQSTQSASNTNADAGTQGGEDGSSETGQPPATTEGNGGAQELLEMSDEFDDPAASETRWSFRHQVEGEDPQFSDFTFGDADDDRARMVPTRGGWYGAFKGPYLFQSIDGDFMIEAQVIAHRSGDEAQAPQQPYNSAGLLIRNRVDVGAPENWVLHHLGMHDPDGAGVGVERKITRNSNSQLTLTANAFSGRIRICRVGDQVVLTRRLDDENAFSISAEYDLQLDDEVQAGFSLTAWNSQTAEPDLSFDGDVVGVWDYVRYYRISDVGACLDEV